MLIDRYDKGKDKVTLKETSVPDKIILPEYFACRFEHDLNIPEMQVCLMKC